MSNSHKAVLNLMGKTLRLMRDEGVGDAREGAQGQEQHLAHGGARVDSVTRSGARNTDPTEQAPSLRRSRGR